MLDSVREDSVERPRDAFEIKSVDEQAGHSGSCAVRRCPGPPELLLRCAVAPRRHLLKRAQPMEIAVGTEDFFDGYDTQRAGQLILQIRYARVEPELPHFRTAEVSDDALRYSEG